MPRQPSASLAPTLRRPCPVQRHPVSYSTTSCPPAAADSLRLAIPYEVQVQYHAQAPPSQSLTALLESYPVGRLGTALGKSERLRRDLTAKYPPSFPSPDRSWPSLTAPTHVDDTIRTPFRGSICLSHLSGPSRVAHKKLANKRCTHSPSRPFIPVAPQRSSLPATPSLTSR
jgi:hypothetical protein